MVPQSISSKHVSCDRRLKGPAHGGQMLCISHRFTGNLTLISRESAPSAGAGQKYYTGETNHGERANSDDVW